MKKNISKYLAYSLTAIAALTLGSCGDDDHFDVTGNPNNLAYFRAGDANSNEFTATVKHTPVGDFSNLSIKLPLYVQRSVAEGTKVTVAIDTTVVAQYNEVKKTKYAALPPAAVELVKPNVVFKADTLASTDSIEVQLLENGLSLLTADEYLMPLRITSVSGGAVGSEERGVIYVKINNVTDYIHVNDNDVVTGTIAHTPVGSFGGIKLDLPAKVSNAAKVGAQATITVDNTLIATYNAENGTSYKEVPAGVLNIENATVTIAEGETASATNFKASIPESKLAQLTEKGYVVPLRISASRADGITVENAGIIYMVIKTENTLINDAATSVTGTALDGATMFTATEKSNLGDLSNLYSGSWSAGWSFQQKSASASFTIDWGSVKNVTGFGISSYLIKNAKVSISADGSTWTELGNTADHTAVNVKQGWSSYPVYVLYGAVPARYIHMDLELDENHQYWQYMQWGYASIDYLSVYTE